MTPTQVKRMWLVAGAAGVLAAGLWGWRLTHPAESMRPETRDTLTALTVTKAPDSVAHALVVKQADTLMAGSRRADVKSRAEEVKAKSNAAVADSLARLAVEAATARDSARLWRGAFVAESLAVAGLDRSLGLARASRDSAWFANDSLKKADVLSQARLLRTENALAQLKQDIVRANKCYVVFSVPCPSRTVSAGLGIAAALGAKTLLAH